MEIKFDSNNEKDLELVRKLVGVESEKSIEKVAVVQTHAVETFMPTALPTSDKVESYTFEQIAKGMVQLRESKGVNEVLEILKRFNAKALTEITPDKYNEIAVILNEKGVKI